MCILFTFVGVKPTLTLLAHRELYAYRTIGFSPDWLVLESYEWLQVWDVTEAGFTGRGGVDLPRGYATCSEKFIMGGRLYTQFNSDDPTNVYSDDIAPILQITGNYGYLVGAVDNRLVYVKGTSSGKYQVDMYRVEENQLHVRHTLMPPEAYVSSSISVCQHPTTGWLAVTQYNTLDIYNGRYEHQVHVTLEHNSCWHNLAAVRGLIVVGSEHHLSFYTWSGALMGHVNTTDLGVSNTTDLSVSKDLIQGVGRAGESRVAVAVGSGDFVRDLFLFTLL